MDEAAAGEITGLLRAWNGGDRAAMGELIPFVYRDLRRLAQHCLKGEQPLTLEATALVHEVYCQLLRQDRMEWCNREQFFSITTTLMRRMLVDAARERHAEKRGGRQEPRALGDLREIPAPYGNWMDEDTLQLDRALNRLETEDPEKARVVELRFFAGFDVPETACVLGLSESTVKRQWRVARLWLERELRGSAAGAAL